MLPQHVVQFYGEDERELLEHARLFVMQGLDKHEAVIVITNPLRREAMFDGLDLSHTPRLTVVDSTAMRRQLYDGGRLRAENFHRHVGRLIRRVADRSRSRGVRVYGDMVDELWSLGKREDAIELERFWNDLQAQVPFTLYCAYHMSAQDLESDAVSPVLREHSARVPAFS